MVGTRSVGAGRCALVLACLVLLLAPSAGCFQGCPEPDQTQFLHISDFLGSGLAVVRVYGSLIPPLNELAAHSWIVTKRADEDEFHRWEIWICPRQDRGVVCVDTNPPLRGVGTASSFVIGEIIGEAADPIIDFIETESPAYEYQDIYIPVPGPNSNTYIQWILDNNGWDLALPACAVGADWRPPSGDLIVETDEGAPVEP